MTSSKLKSTPRSRLKRATDEALFMRVFQYQSDLSIDDTCSQLDTLGYQPGKITRVFFPRQRIVSTETIDDNLASFHIQSKLGGLYTELHARGHIHHDEATGKMHVIGEVKFDPVYLTVLLAGLFFLITWALAGLSRFGSLPSPFILFTLGLTNLYYFRQMFVDRNMLLQSLQEVIHTDDITSARKRLADVASSQQDTDIQSTQHQANSKGTS